MSGLEDSTEFVDVSLEAYVSGPVTVGTTAIEAKVGATRLHDRELLIILNNGPTTIFVGPSGVTPTTGMPIYKCQAISLPAGDSVGVFLIAQTGTCHAIVQEMA